MSAENVTTKTLVIDNITIREVTEGQAKEVMHAIETAIVETIGRPSNGSAHHLQPNFGGKGRSEAEAAQAAKEGRR